MASIGPLALGAKGCVERLHPTGETTHYDLCVAGAPANHVRCASLRSGGRRLAVRTAMEHPIGALPRTPFPASRDFPSRGNEKIGGTGYCVTYDTDSQSRNVLASPLGEEGHEVAKGCTRVRMIMILDVDVTAERRHYNTYRPRGRYHNPQRRRRCRPLSEAIHNPPPTGGHNPRGAAPSTLTPKV